MRLQRAEQRFRISSGPKGLWIHGMVGGVSEQPKGNHKHPQNADKRAVQVSKFLFHMTKRFQTCNVRDSQQLFHDPQLLWKFNYFSAKDP